MPVVSYLDATHGSLKVAKCGNAACSSGNTLSVVDTGSIAYPSMTIGSDGMPIMTYYDSANQDLKMAKCGNAACSAGNLLTSLDSGYGDVGWFSTITIGTDGLPIIAYINSTYASLRVLKCANVYCLSNWSRR